MKRNYLKCVSVMVVLLACVWTMSAAEEVLPRITLDNVPLSAVIQNLARQAGMNYILDPRVPGSDSAPGAAARNPSVSVSWTNVSTGMALTALLKGHQLMIVTNPATTVARIAFTNHNVKPIPASAVGTNASKVIPLVVMDSVPLTDAVTKLAEAAGLKVLVDPRVSSVLDGTVAFRWENITARQALAVVLDNYDLVMVEDGVSGMAKVVLRTSEGKN